jgi:hypothetical protein
VLHQFKLTYGRRCTAAPISRIRRVGLRRPGPFYRSAVEANGHFGSATWIRQD